MKKRVVVGAVAALSLVACGGPARPADSSAKPAAATSSELSTRVSPTPAATTTPAAPAKGTVPNRDFLIGKWGTDGDCTLAIDLRPDGTSDGPFGNWTYTDGTIGFVGEPDFKVHVTVIDDKTMESTNGSGKTAKMTRCP